MDNPPFHAEPKPEPADEVPLRAEERQLDQMHQSTYIRQYAIEAVATDAMKRETPPPADDRDFVSMMPFPIEATRDELSENGFFLQAFEGHGSASGASGDGTVGSAAVLPGYVPTSPSYLPASPYIAPSPILASSVQDVRNVLISPTIPLPKRRVTFQESEIERIDDAVPKVGKSATMFAALSLDEDLEMASNEKSKALGHSGEKVGDGSDTESERTLQVADVMDQQAVMKDVDVGEGELDENADSIGDENSDSGNNSPAHRSTVKTMPIPSFLPEMKEVEELNPHLPMPQGMDEEHSIAELPPPPSREPSIQLLWQSLNPNIWVLPVRSGEWIFASFTDENMATSRFDSLKILVDMDRTRITLIYSFVSQLNNYDKTTTECSFVLPEGRRADEFYTNYVDGCTRFHVKLFYI